MPLIAEAQLTTGHASRYLAELCRQLDHKAQANRELDVHVAWTDTDGTVDLGWGRCTMRADESTLLVRVEADDDDALRHVRELISRHLEKLADDDHLAFAWRQDGIPVADTDAERRHNMRGFHRRMRH